MYNNLVNHKLEIEGLKFVYQHEQRLCEREYDSVKMILAQSEKEKQQARQKYHLLNQKYQEKKIIDILDEQSLQSKIKNDGTRLFKTAKYAILGLERKQDEFELPNKTEKIQTEKSQTADPQIQTFQAYDSQINAKFLEDEQSRIYQSEDEKNYSQSLINFINDFENERKIYTTQERVPDYTDIPQKQIKSQGQSATITFTYKEQPENQISAQSQEKQIGENAYFHFHQNTSRTDMDNNIDQQLEILLDDIQGIVDKNTKQAQQTLITHKLRLQNERPQKTINFQRKANFHPVNFVQNSLQQEEPLTKRAINNSKQVDNLDQLILDLCN
ncbi:unnamed protein product [Paramecium sonneborni]|uniref:Uncharacterized protein n=1 Tax=Paramecium sonneborni TaxID=65129 RepID=A0A8S1RKB7_9CILI|nr:unnamed protein product [Paramecium sonneborni]